MNSSKTTVFLSLELLSTSRVVLEETIVFWYGEGGEVTYGAASRSVGVTF